MNHRKQHSAPLPLPRFGDLLELFVGDEFSIYNHLYTWIYHDLPSFTNIYQHHPTSGAICCKCASICISGHFTAPVSVSGFRIGYPPRHYEGWSVTSQLGGDAFLSLCGSTFEYQYSPKKIRFHRDILNIFGIQSPRQKFLRLPTF